ncbi:MAG: ParB N-terminal domain-containing protein [Oscillospiraceae bacterium]|nr:ParB N-terminal domain-containing protein [Oscillospiraceae bacterium]
MQIPIYQINVNAGRREADQEAVQKLADSISKVGLLNPITVDQEYTLIAGLHRLEAAKRLGWTEIECMVSSLDGLLAELAEIDENFVRRDLSDAEFRELLLHRKEIYESLHPEAKHGGDRSKRTKCPFASAKSFADDTADKWGVDPRTVRREIQTAKNLTSEAKIIIGDMKITKKDALKLSRLPPEQQEDAATQLAAGDIHSVDEYHPAPAEPQSLEQPEAPAPASQAAEICYPTIKASVDDLKNPDKDRRRTPDTFLMTFSFFLQRFCAGVANYATPEHEVIFPSLTREQLEQLRAEIQSVHTALDGLYHKIERKARQ